MDTIFVIDKETCIEKLKDGGTKKRYSKKKFHLECLDLVKGKKVHKEATEQEYIDEFYLTLIRIELYELEDFLQFHLDGSSNKAKYLNIVKAISKSELVKYPAIKETALEWLKSSVCKSNTKTIKEQKQKADGIKPGTAKRYQERFQYYQKLNPKHGHTKAVKLTAEHFSVSEKTIYRAIENH